MKLYKHSYRNGIITITEIEVRETKTLYISRGVELSRDGTHINKFKLNQLYLHYGYSLVSNEPNVELFKNLIELRIKSDEIAIHNFKEQLKNCEVQYA